VRIDHVIYATTDLDAASSYIEGQVGVEAVQGGRHEGLGTKNRIVPLGGGYIELLAVDDPDEAARSTFGAALTARIAGEGDGLFGWATAVEDLEDTAERLGTAITTIRREGLSARLTGLAEAMREPYLPFFVQRDPGVPDPGAGGDAGGITWIEVGGNAARLKQWLGDGELPVQTVDPRPRVHAVGIGDRALRTSSPG
jgi:hypothetical protein